MSLSESTLNVLCEDEVIALALEYKKTFDSTLAKINKEISDLRQNYERMDSGFCVTRRVCLKLREEIVSLERECWSDCQYSRRENLELSGFRESMEDSELEDSLKLFKIEDYDWFPSKGPKRVNLKFSRRKDANSSQKVQKNLNGMDLSLIGIRSPVYVNDSLCKCYKMLCQKCKKFCVNKFIHLFWVSNGSIRLKLSDNERSYIIIYINALEELLPGNEFMRHEE